MSEISTTTTSITSVDAEPCEVSGFMKSLALSAAFVVRLAAASTNGGRRCFLEVSAATQPASGSLAESSTQLREMASATKARFQALLDPARDDIIEDGMRNVVNERLPELVAKDFDTFIHALVSALETTRITPIVAAELLKELGRLRDPEYHQRLLWVLERGLSLSSAIIRDGAGLGLARLGDPHSIPYLHRAVQGERNAQTRADLQLVIDELAETISDGVPVTNCE